MHFFFVYLELILFFHILILCLKIWRLASKDLFVLLFVSQYLGYFRQFILLFSIWCLLFSIHILLNSLFLFQLLFLDILFLSGAWIFIYLVRISSNLISLPFTLISLVCCPVLFSPVDRKRKWVKEVMWFYEPVSVVQVVSFIGNAYVIGWDAMMFQYFRWPYLYINFNFNIVLHG